jgi:hypothetical protein
MKTITWLKNEEIHGIIGGQSLQTANNNFKITANQHIDTGDKNNKYKNKQEGSVLITFGSPD